MAAGKIATAATAHPKAAYRRNLALAGAANDSTLDFDWRALLVLIIIL
jgi:hypothetical protein